MSIEKEEVKSEVEEASKADETKSKKNSIIRIACASGGFIAVVALCILSSRFSWFGTQASGNVSGETGTSSSVTTETEKAPTKAIKPVETPAATTAATVSSTTAVTTTTAKTTKSTTSATTKATSKTTTTTATTAAPKPAWTEEKCSGTMYINISSCSARKEGLQGSEVIAYKYYGDAVKVTALTNTGYYKLDDGTYVHSDYLSKTKPVETTTTTTAAPKPASTPSQNNTQVTSTITDQPVNCTAEEAEVFRLINEIRVSYGLNPYKWDTNAYKAAKARCDEIFNVFSHTRPDGSNFKSIYGYSDDEIWYKFRYVGENLGSGQPTAQEVVDSWMNSTAGHRENILNPNFENLAVAFGKYNDSYKYYWVQEFTTYR